MKHIVNPAHGRAHTVYITHVANVELELGMVVALAHVVLLFLIAAKDADLLQIRIQKSPQARHYQKNRCHR
jgi:hypothetical protein